MNNDNKDNTKVDLYPDHSPEEQEQAAENWRQYVRVVWRIFERLEQEGKVPKNMYRAAEKRRRRLKRQGKL